MFSLNTIAGRLTVEVLGALTYILCENKTKPDHEQLLKLTPVSIIVCNQCMYINK